MRRDGDGADGRQGDVQVDAHAEGELDDQHDQDGQIGLPQASLRGFVFRFLRGWRGSWTVLLFMSSHLHHRQRAAPSWSKATRAR